MFISKGWYSLGPLADKRSPSMERQSLELHLTPSQWLRVVMTLGVDTPEAQAIVGLLKRVHQQKKQQDAQNLEPVAV